MRDIDIKWPFEAYCRARKDSAAGVDGQTAVEYRAKLGTNLSLLLDRAKSGDHYRAPPVRRVHIPKGDGKNKTRPIGIPTFEDKVLQRAVATVLEAVYEQDFFDCSYGFRPGRSPHQAVQEMFMENADAGGSVGTRAHITLRGDLLVLMDIREAIDKSASPAWGVEGG